MKPWQGVAAGELLAGNWQQCAVDDPFGAIPQSAGDRAFGEILRNAGDREFGAILQIAGDRVFGAIPQSAGDRAFGSIWQLLDSDPFGAIRKRVVFGAFGERRQGAGSSVIRLARFCDVLVVERSRYREIPCQQDIAGRVFRPTSSPGMFHVKHSGQATYASATRLTRLNNKRRPLKADAFAQNQFCGEG